MARRKTSTPKNNSKAAQTEAASKNDPRVLADIPEGITVRPGETIIEAGLSEELSFSFMDYAMAVIVSRALPDAADGLKPVQRRILWAMYKSGSRPGGKFSKSAGHVGETMGKYHPHGDCLDGDTRIASVDGTRPTLRELTEHGVDEVDVWATDRNGNLVPARAHSFRIGQYADTVYSIHLADGSEVRATANHPFRSVTGEWVKAENLKIGDLLTSARIEGGGDVERRGDHNGFNNHPENLQVVDIEIEALEEPEPMFDFTVDDYENLHIVTSENDGVEQLLCVHNSAIYATMVRLAQDFNNNLPFVDGQGNFGSLDDSAAAPRYTEARLADASMAALADIDEDVVDFIPNYDGTRQEPKVLPMRIPTLLVNGATGIAVGMATNIAPHNLTEVAEAAKHILWNPKATPDELRQYVTGPDFPSGGTVLGGGGLDEAYRTGKGSVTIRGRSRVVTEGRRTNIVIDELPYQIGAEKFITAVVEEVEKGRIDGIRDISDHSDRNTGLRVVIELKAGVDPEAVLALLHKHTPLEQRFSIQQVALVGGEPRLLNLAELLSVWVEHQLDVVVRRTRHRHGKAQERIHIVEGLIVALDNIDEVVAVIKKSQNPDTARRNLKKAIGVDDTQAGYIIDMPLRRLTSLETKKLRDEAKELAAEIKRLAKVLKSNKAQRQLVADELDAWVQQLGWERRSRVVDEWETLEVPASVETEDGPCYVTLTHSGLIGRDEGGRRQLGSDDILAAELAGTTRGMVYLTDQRGETHRIPGYVIPAASGRSRGTRPSQFLDMAAGARLVGGWTDTDLEAGRIPAVITRSGVVKLVNPDTLASRGETQQIINLDDGDEIVWVGAVGREDELWFITQAGQVLRTAAAPIRPQGRNAGGVAGIKLSDDDQVIAAGSTNADNVGGAVVVVATDGGRLKATPADEYPAKGRAGMGVRSIRLLKGETRLVAAAVAAADRWVVGAAKTVAALDRADYVAKRDASGTPVPDGAAVEVIGNARP